MEERNKLLEEQKEIDKKIMELYTVYAAKTDKLGKRKLQIVRRLAEIDAGEKKQETCEPCNPDKFQYYNEQEEK